MGLRFRKSFKIAPGVRLNINKKSTSLSFGGKGLRYNINSSGKRTTSVGVPGTGLSYVSTSTSGKSYKTKAYQTHRNLQNQAKGLQREQEKEWVLYEVQLFENQCELVKSIHKECDDPVDWRQILNSQPPHQYGEPGMKEKEAIKKYKNYQPGFFDKLFKKDEQQRNKLLEQIEQAKVKDEQEYREWQELVALAEKVLDGDIDAYFSVIQEMNPLDDLSEFGSGFEFSTDDPSYMEIEMGVHSDKVIPKEEKSLTKTGKLSTKQMTKTRYFELQQDFVCSCILRIARDLFALLPLKTVIIHAYDEQMDTATGHIKKVVILSTKIDRERLNQLNFEFIDCSDAMTNFPHNMKFLKTKGFSSVEKIIRNGTID